MQRLLPEAQWASRGQSSRTWSTRQPWRQQWTGKRWSQWRTWSSLRTRSSWVNEWSRCSPQHYISHYTDHLYIIKWGDRNTIMIISLCFHFTFQALRGGVLKLTRRIRPLPHTTSPAMPLLPITPKMQCPSIRLLSCLEDQLWAMWAFVTVLQYCTYFCWGVFWVFFDKPCRVLGVDASREWPLERDTSPAAGSDGRQHGRPSSRGAHLWER